jgi:O-antigen ligase
MPRGLTLPRHLSAVGLGAWPLLTYVAVVPIAFSAMSLFLQGSAHDVTRIAQLLALLLAAMAWCRRAWQTGSDAKLHGGLICLLLWALASASIAQSASYAMAGRELALALGCVAAVVATADACRERRDVLLLVVTWSCFVYALMMVGLAFATVTAGNLLVWQDLAIGYDNYRFFNHVQTVALPLLAIVAGRQPDGRHGRLMRTLAWFSSVVYWAYVFCSGARGTALAIAFALLCTSLVAGWRTTAPVARALTVSAVGGAVAYVMVFVLLPAAGLLPMGASTERSLPSFASDSSRLLLWRIARDDIVASPWLGIGPMHYAHFPNPKAAHPHNIYLQVAAEWGIPMLLVLLTLIGGALWRLARTIRALPTGLARAEGVGLLVACLAILADGFVSGNFVMPVSQMWIVLCCAWTVAWTSVHRPASSTAAAASMAWPRLMAGALLASQAWLVMDVWPEAAHLGAHLTHVQRDLAHNARTSPRFWSDGWF